jgi:fumarylacetoacetate (FAA) hydrolase
MKLVTFASGRETRHGALITANGSESVLDLSTALAAHEADAGRPSSPDAVAARYGRDLLGFIERQDESMPAARAVLARVSGEGADLPASFEGAPLRRSLAEVKLLAPIPRPPSMRDGYAFRQHVLTARKNRGLDMIPEFDQFPVFYFTNHQAVVGPGDVPVMPLHLERLDYELEAAVVIGRRGRNVKAERADALVFGLTIMNDLSARVLQMEEMKLSLGPAKGKDFATALGPYLVTLDELEDRTTRGPKGASYDLKMTAAVNGKQLSEGNLQDMTWTFAEILERASYGVDLFPGDVIGSGTVGTGCLLELNGSGITKDLWLKVGDVVTLDIERLGRLENRFVAEAV